MIFNIHIVKLLLTLVALRDSAPLAGLARAASLSSESLSSGSLISITWLFLVGFLDLEFMLPDQATVTPFTEVVRDFAEVPDTRGAGTDQEELAAWW